MIAYWHQNVRMVLMLLLSRQTNVSTKKITRELELLCKYLDPGTSRTPTSK